MAPVSVARSTRRVAPSRTAYTSPSARISRPSASVLMTSMVVPFMAVRTSPGLTAWPLGMFSVDGTTASTSTGRPRAATRPAPSITAAPPHMSIFMSSMPLEGLMEMPPLSKVTALPTSPSTSPRRATRLGR